MAQSSRHHPSYLVSAARNGNVEMVSKILAELKNSEWGHSERVRPALSSRVWSSLVLLAGGRRNRATEAATPFASVVANRVVEISQQSRERSSSSFSSSTVRTSSTNRRSVASMLRSGGNSGGGGGGGGSGGRRGTRRSNYDGIHDNADPTSPATQSDPINDVGGRKGRVARLTHFTSGQSFDEFNDDDENPEEPDPTGIVDLDDVKIPTPAMATATSSIGANNQLTMNSNTTNSFNSRSTVSYDGGGISFTPPSSVGSNSYQGSLQSAPDHYRDRRREDGGGPSFEKENSHSLTNPDRHHSSFRNSNSTSYKSIIFAESISLSRSLATLERNAFRSLALMPPSSLPNPIQNVDRNSLSNEVADALDQDIGTWTALHFACDRQDEKGARIVELMLSAGADPCIENSAGDTPLHLAVDAGNDSSVLALLQCGAKADAIDTRGVGPLHIACKRGNARVTHWLLTFGKASPNKLTERSKSALHYAINGALSSTQNHSGVTDCVDLLLAAGANPNVASRPSLETPLHIAARCGHSKVVSALMRRGANVRLANCDKDEPQKIALRYGHTAVAKQITGHWRIAYFLLMELAARDVVTLRVMPVVGPDQDVNLTREASVLLNVGKKLPKNIKAQICKFL